MRTEEEFEAVEASFTSLCEQHGWQVEKKPLSYGIQLRIEDHASSATVNIYKGKRGVSVVIGGATKSELGKALLRFHSEHQVREVRFRRGERTEDRGYRFGGRPRIGTDEAGKGDYFGPLVVAAAYVDQTTEVDLLDLGLRDSKRIADERAKHMAEAIRGRIPFAVVVVGPEEYNQRYKEMRNLNKLLAWGHSLAIRRLLESVDCTTVLSDKFGDERYLTEALDAAGEGLKLFQFERAEADAAVAAASVLARDEYLRSLDALSRNVGLDLPKGATHVLEAGRILVARNGPEALRRVAKWHFKTTRQILAQ